MYVRHDIIFVDMIQLGLCCGCSTMDMDCLAHGLGVVDYIL